MQATLKALYPAVVVLLALAVYEIFPKSVKSYDTALIAIATFIIIAFLRIHLALAILGAAILGFAMY